MTSSEFKRKLNYFTPLDSAVYFFSSPLINSVFKRTMVYVDNSVFVDYVVHCYAADLDSDFCQHVWFDRFSRSQFNAELGFFRSFVSKLTTYQYSVLESCKSLSNLFNLIKNEQKTD